MGGEGIRDDGGKMRNSAKEFVPQQNLRGRQLWGGGGGGGENEYNPPVPLLLMSITT